MSKITRTSIAILGAATLASIASAANAQPGRYYGDRGDYTHRYEQRADNRLTSAYVDGLQWRIQEAARERRISWNQARDLQHDLSRVQPIAYRYQTGQARPWEVNQLQRTIDRIDAVTSRRF
jgi:hypothetical protein